MPSAIVLHITRYSDTGSIAHLYTAEHGRMQYVVYGNKMKGLLQPLSIIEYTSTRRTNAPGQMGILSSASLLYTPQQLGTDIQRQCVAMFIAEVLVSTLRHPMSDQPLFDWMEQQTIPCVLYRQSQNQDTWHIPSGIVDADCLSLHPDPDA